MQEDYRMRTIFALVAVAAFALALPAQIELVDRKSVV